VVTPVDATDPAIDDVVRKFAVTPGARGIRIRMRDGLPMDADHPGLNRAFAAAPKYGLPVNLLCWGILDKALPHIQRHRDTVIVIDHLGLLQPARPPVPAEVWADLPKLLALAQYENVRVKISGACTMSHQQFPYDDIWEPVLRIIDAFGLNRCMWGTDWTRTIGMLSYEQGVGPWRDTSVNNFLIWYPDPEGNTEDYSKDDWEIYFLSARKFLINHTKIHICPKFQEGGRA
jgi:L-fuconolactonase